MEATESAESTEPESVRGLMDSQRVADYLNIPRATIRSWAKRKADGVPGVHAQFPDPLEETLGGTALWDDAQIRTFKETFYAATQSRKKGKNRDATSLLQPVESKNE